ncbi:hypothetical protein PPACK8108_LOCUS1391 [Phakopsora pachyrhizi]|uniref:Cullin family profile domain-containing protein n=1 Tax=Phakopsora pachyrhizi TaxID=170000 RepID=A0AAV0AH15_PHAPC|nr:hypothetical protein PPACK8108_LOCUS1391 [Phakopsora pachyrhizi]
MKASAILSIPTGELQSSSVCLLMTNLRKDSKKTDEEIEDQLEKTISLHRHLIKKDLFEKYYKKKSCKELKAESGSAFTRDSEGFQHKL